MPDSTYAKALRRAADLVGGTDELRKRLWVTPHELAEWIAGDAAPPHAVFRRVVDLIAASSQGLRLRAGMRVLIVSDERDTVMTLGILLRSEGFDVQLAQAGAEVLRAVHEFRPYAVLLDIGMPERKGYAVARALTKEHGGACPYLVAVAPRRGDSDGSMALDCGFRDQVARPCEQPDHLLALLDSLNRERQRAEPLQFGAQQSAPVLRRMNSR